MLILFCIISDPSLSHFLSLSVSFGRGRGQKRRTDQSLTKARESLAVLKWHQDLCLSAKAN